MTNNSVITEEQARATTGVDYAPLTLGAYQLACAKLRECLTIIETKRFMDAGEAFALLGKLKGDHEAIRLARALSLQAARRADEIARASRPGGRSRPPGSLPGPKSYLIEHGLSPTVAQGVHIVGAMTRAEFDAMCTRSKPPTLSQVRRYRDGCSVGEGLSRAAAALQNIDARDTAMELDIRDLQAATKKAQFISEWADEFIAVAERRRQGGQ